MKNKTFAIVKTLIEKLKRNTGCFGELTAIETHGTYGSRAEIVMRSGDNTEVYSVIVIKNAT